MKTRPVPRSRRRLRKEAVQSRTRRRARSGRAHRVGSRAWLLRASLVAVITISAVGLLGTGGTIGVVDYFAGDLPSIDQLQSSKLEQTTRIVDRNGNLIAAVYHENRTVVPLSKISKNLQAATIDTEDRTFYSNSGVDSRRLLIAIAYDLTHPSSTLGGSTITQQVVKNDVLDTAEAQTRTISRKFRELVLAEEMERHYTKQQILELYMNTINYGNGAYGVEAAAETYFGVHAADVSWAQATFLAGLPQAPAYYDPFGKPGELAAATERWREVLDGVVTVGDLSSTEADALFKSDFLSRMVAAHKSRGPQPNPLTAHFADYVEQYILQNYGATAMYEGGLTVTTTLDLGTQALADKWVKAGVRKYASRAVNTGAMLVMNPEDGEIIAMVGSADYNNAAIRGQVNLTGVDPLGWRGVGSSFKGYTYGAALEAGLITPASLLDDQNTVIGGRSLPRWGAHHRGWVPLCAARAQSRKPPPLWSARHESGT